MRNHIVTSPDRLEAADRHAQAFQLRLAGHDYATIARKLDYCGKQGAHEAVRAELERRIGKPCEAFRQLELARLDTLWRSLFEKYQMLIGDPEKPITKTVLEIADRLVRIALARGRLSGLDKPVGTSPNRDEDDQHDDAEATAFKAPPLTREAQLAVLLERLQARVAQQAVPVVNEIVEHFHTPCDDPRK